MNPYSEYIQFKGAPKTERIAVEWIHLSSEQQSFLPRVCSTEEFFYVVSGYPHIWINETMYQLEPGVAIGFSVDNELHYSFINQTTDPVEILQLGQKNAVYKTIPMTDSLRSGEVKNLKNIQNVYLLERQKSFSYPGDVETFSNGVRLSDIFGFKFLGVWHEIMKNGKRSSWPHAHRLEEELVIILKGTGQVWMNGFIQDVQPGDCVHFKSGTNIAHTLMNQSGEAIEFLGIGEAAVDEKEEKIIYPLHYERNLFCQQDEMLWMDAPSIDLFGSHLGIPLNKNILVQEVIGAQNFLNKARHFLLQKEAEYGLMLGLAEIKAKNNEDVDSQRYFWIDNQDGFAGAAIVTEKNIVITAMPAPLLLRLGLYLHLNQIKSPGVVGPAHSAEAFARIHSQNYGISYKIAMNQKIYQLDKVIQPSPVQGRMVAASSQHIDLASEWLMKFIEESIPHEATNLENARKIMAAKIEKQELFIWIDQHEVPVALNMVMRPTPNGITVSFVYTPKDQRKKGYASALVAQTSQRMLDAGKKFCVLYTDATNPTSNGIYQKIGYKEIATSKNFIFLN